MKHFCTIILLVMSGIRLLTAGTDPQTDSLLAVLSKGQEDTNKVGTLLALAKKYYSSNAEYSNKYSLQAKELSQKLGFKRGTAFSDKSLGMSYFLQGKYVEALEYWQQSLVDFEVISDKTGIANILSNIGAVYFNQGDDAKALGYYFKSLKASEDLGDKLRIATAQINIGAVYVNKKATYDKALEYYLKALPLSQELGDKNAIGTCTVNIGEIYMERGDYKNALYYFEKSIKANENSENLPYTFNNIGKVYANLGNFTKALDYQQKAYNLSKKLESKYDMTQSLIFIANTLEKMGNFKDALRSYTEALKIAIETGSAYEQKNAYTGLAKSYAALGNYKMAFKYQTLFTNIKDTLYNIETDKKISGLLFNYEIDKKQGQINLLEKDKDLQHSKLQKQKVIRDVSFGGLAMVLLFLVVVMFQKRKISFEKKRSEELLLNILPSETAEELKATGSAKAKSFDEVTVMFTDFKNFTLASEKLSAVELVNEINYCFSAFDNIISKYGIEKIKTIGDSYMCVAGLPVNNPNHASDIIRAGLEMQEFIADNIRERKERGDTYFELRLGVHSGPVVAGIVGIKKFAYDIWGDTVNTASRMESSGEPGKVNISGTTYEFVKDQFVFTYRGRVNAKNKGMIDMYFVESENVRV